MTYIGLTLETFCGIWVFNLKSSQHSTVLYDAEQLYVKNKMAAELKSETFSGNTIKEGLSIDTTFDPLFFVRQSL